MKADTLAGISAAQKTTGSPPVTDVGRFSAALDVAIIMLSIRPESPDDLDAIGAVTIQAFADSEFGHHGEAELIDLLRANCEQRVSLVACLEGRIVGHVLFSPVVILAEGREIRGMGLAPMSVLPECQKAGIGSRLVMSGLERLTDDGCPFVVVLGHPEYYPRFGFLPAANFGVRHGFPGIPQDLFFIKNCVSDMLPSPITKAAYYRPEFGPQHESA